MSIIPEFYKSKNEDYITIPVLKKFIKESIGTQRNISSLNKEDCWKNVESFAEESEHNKELVFSWIDNIMGEGIQESYIYSRICEPTVTALISNEKAFEGFITKYLSFHVNCHLCDHTYNSDLSLVRATLENGKNDFVRLLFCKKLYYRETKNSNVIKSIYYPIVSEYYYKSGWLVIKAKSKSNIYEYTDVFSDTTPPTSPKKQIESALARVEQIFAIHGDDKKKDSHNLKIKVFKFLDSLVKTPYEIQEILDSLSEQMDSISDNIAEFCSVNDGKINDVKEDIKNLFEKHISINYSDINVFKKGKVAYPIRLSATDEEETKVETTAGRNEPLQTKAAFFDSKKTLYNQQSCERLTLMWKRKSQDLFSEDYIPVKIKVGISGECVISFRKFTAKEDIDDVIWAIVNF